MDRLIVTMAMHGDSAVEIMTATGLTAEQLRRKSVDLWISHIQVKGLLPQLVRIYGECVG